MRIVKLKKWHEFYKYSLAFEKEIGYRIPHEYFLKSNVWALIDDNGIILGGFAISEHDQRVIRELPKTFDKNILFKNYAELTGYFIKSKNGSVALTFRMIMEVLKSKKLGFIYAYPSDDLFLKKYYSAGSPTLIYSGKPRKIEGHPHGVELESQNFEILSKGGVVKIFINRTMKIIKMKCKRIFKIFLLQK